MLTPMRLEQVFGSVVVTVTLKFPHGYHFLLLDIIINPREKSFSMKQMTHMKTSG